MIRGITFKEQTVYPEDDGRLYASIFNDGILSGCAFNSTGYTLTMTPGLIIACGRLVSNPTAQNFAITGASEGYARLSLIIDLSKPASYTNFEQLGVHIDYSLSLSGFSEPLQLDINSGTAQLYELPLAVCTLSINGIKEITYSLPTAEFKTGDV